ncbi:MAG TPA: aminotransferase class V-fold PLP-dependent enzyme [Gaiellaceae bacterium]|nr:aminotransferase class V-fold PLP-dependent enzyme [Gaiellaceae bacterium]HKU56734.1 aminotransferase class V-fold PLP-dependent enzyme [Gaiellaceae bacterium]
MAAPSAAELREEFLLDSEVAFLNHGSFGACPRPVFERYQAWQAELEREPVDFLDRRLSGLLDSSRAGLADYVGCPPQDLAFVPNATTGVNLAARSLELRPGDEVLTTDLEYGACDRAWEWVCRRAGARYVRAPIALPLGDPDDLVEALFASASERTRAVFVSHVASTTGLVLPVEEVVARAGARGLVTIVDGAHAPAQVPVDLEALGADYFAGNAHKWLGAPKGAGFLHVRPEHQDRVDAAIVGWGYEEGTAFTRRIESQGTRDPAAWLTVPDAIGFQGERDWDDVRDRCRGLARAARRELCDLVGTEPLSPDSMVAQMAAVRLPRPTPGLSERLFTRHRIEIPVTRDAQGDLLRLSVAAYTTRDEVDRLLAALARELDAEHRQEHE